ncbi:MAG: DNA gyrase inhibitor YacG [Thermaurantiacus sp.]
MCGRTPVAALAPFCSATCRDRDLLAWLDGRYALPSSPGDAEECQDGPFGASE